MSSRKDKGLIEIDESFSSAESSIKNCENITGELHQGAVNELRYAAQHLIKYFTSKREQEELQKVL